MKRRDRPARHSAPPSPDGYDFQSWYGLWAPKGTPREICGRINALMRETMQDPAIVQRLNASLLEPVVETTEETKAFIAAEVPKHVRRCCEEGGVRGAVVIPPAAPRAAAPPP